MNWNNITLKQYLAIQEAYTTDCTDYERAGMLVKAVFGKDIEDIPISKIDPYITEITTLLNSEMPKGKVKKKYTINKHTYILSPAIEDMTTSQFWDFTEYSKDPKNIAKVLACFLIPEGKKYGEDREVVLADMEELSIVDVNCIAFFLLNRLKQLQRTIMAYSVVELMKGMSWKKKLKMLKHLYLVCRNMGYLTMS